MNPSGRLCCETGGATVTGLSFRTAGKDFVNGEEYGILMTVNGMKKQGTVRTGKKRTWLYTLLLFLGVAVLLYSAYQLISIWVEDSQGDAINQELEKYVSYGEPADKADPDVPETLEYAVDFAALREQNGDIYAWLLSPDTVINYPVVQGQDNSYYLTHTFSGERHKYGSLFVDAANNPGFSDQNTVIHGHRMNSGAMFGSLLQYRDREYYRQHPHMLLFTPEANYRLEIFAAYEAMTDSMPIQRNFASQEEYQAFLDAAFGRSGVTTGVEVGVEDRIVTLSTCVERDDTKRFVVHGKLTRLD